MDPVDIIHNAIVDMKLFHESLTPQDIFNNAKAVIKRLQMAGYAIVPEAKMEKPKLRDLGAFDGSSVMKFGTPLLMCGELVYVLDDSTETLVVEASQGTSLFGSDGLSAYKIWTGAKWRAGMPRKIRVVVWGEEFFCRKCKTVMEIRKRMPGKPDECLFC